ncbi:ABC transporter ATP-binding protein [Stomatobaculum longum]|uniref:ABC transporter ATP-binding protein n=1 Tax=Stomatobaculum longum TaxID=796942 RepID=UPI002804374E|nr:ABC transporter ATP-binding protein [Stomatobaculum longum]
MNQNENAIEVRGVSKFYNLYERPQDRVKELFSLTKKKYHTLYKALDQVSFTVKKGETLGIIGRNGAGKSTLLKLITGVITPSEGTIETHGEISALLELGTGFNPEYTGYENIFLNGSMRGFSDEEMQEKVKEIVDFADIGEYMGQPVKTYSSGMFARLAFAVMISFKPEILIVDEALSVGDIFFQQKCNTFMKEEMKGVTKLLVTHDMNSIANMADRVILIDRGKIIREGKPLEVIEDYLKLLHTSVFQSEEAAEKDEDARLATAERSEVAERKAVAAEAAEREKEKAEIGWVDSPKESIGGAQDILIDRCRMLINGEAVDVVKPGDAVRIELLLHSKKDADNIIIGYTFKDKYGNSIFAQSTLGEGIMIEGVKQGEVRKASLSFHWPEVKEGDYFLTLGLGEGYDQMVHTVQCWVHSVLHVQAIALKPMHGVINHVIEEFKIERIEHES